MKRYIVSPLDDKYYVVDTNLCMEVGEYENWISADYACNRLNATVKRNEHWQQVVADYKKEKKHGV